jgi:hypothetical protein
MVKKTMAIIHFNPIEHYPPIMNLLDYLGKKMPDLNVYVFTNSLGEEQKKHYEGESNIIIARYSVMKRGLSLFRRYRNYFTFYLKTYHSLKKIVPDWLWYFETISAMPVSWYFSHQRTRKTKLLIHYHEYMSPDEYQNGPFLVREIHKMEKLLYKIGHTLSHTNEKRLQLFLQDNDLTLDGNACVLPNYPPGEWVSAKREHMAFRSPVRFVHVGGIDIESLYLKEFCEWADQQNGRVYFDIYSHQNTRKVEDFLSENKYRFTNIKGYVPYESLPPVLSSYDVGLILYKGHIPNNNYIAPNKLFEYWACGLDVWFPETLNGTLSFARKGSYPKLLPLNFKKLVQLDLESAIDHSGLTYQASPYNCEQALDEYLHFVGVDGN